MVFHIPQKDVQKLESIQKLVLNVCLKSWDGSYSTYKLVISHALWMDVGVSLQGGQCVCCQSQ